MERDIKPGITSQPVTITTRQYFDLSGQVDVGGVKCSFSIPLDIREFTPDEAKFIGELATARLQRALRSFLFERTTTQKSIDTFLQQKST